MNKQAEAIANGQKRYTTGKACRRGHMGERYACSGLCVDCVRHNDKVRKETIAQAAKLRNTRLFEPARVYSALVRPQHHAMFNKLANVVARENRDTIAQINAFVDMLASQI